MEVHVAFSADLGVNLYYVAPTTAIKDPNYAETLEQSTWYFMPLADLADGGFLLDGTAELYDPTADGTENGKIGLLSRPGSSFTVSVSAQSTIPAITIEFRDSEGTVEANGNTYTIQQYTVIPVNASSISLYFHNSSATKRIQIGSIFAGISVVFDTESIISCNLSLQSDLKPDNPSLPISSIEMTALYREDLSSVIGAMPDNAPITYYSGYPGDYSPVRQFYLSEPAQIKDGVIELHGEDSVRFIDGVEVGCEWFTCKTKKAANAINWWMVNKLSAAGVPVATTTPAQSGTSTGDQDMIINAGSLRDHIANIMNLCRSDVYFPSFVDAGRPRLTISKPTASYTINESDCGDVEIAYDRQIAVIKTDDDHGVKTIVSGGIENDELETDKKVTMNKRYTINGDSDNYYWRYIVSGQKVNVVWQNPLSFAFRPTRTSYKTTVNGKTVWKDLVDVEGWRVTFTDSNKTLRPADNRSGAEMDFSPMTYGTIIQSNSDNTYTRLYPIFDAIFDRSNVTGSFTWKGNPKMQPRDVFNFVRLDGTTEVCTVEAIELKHERGGLSATISYRKGIV
jgi:hypothetical protein